MTENTAAFAWIKKGGGEKVAVTNGRRRRYFMTRFLWIMATANAAFDMTGLAAQHAVESRWIMAALFLAAAATWFAVIGRPVIDQRDVKDRADG